MTITDTHQHTAALMNDYKPDILLKEAKVPYDIT